MRSALTKFGIRTVAATLPSWVQAATAGRWEAVPTTAELVDIDPADDGFTVEGAGYQFLIDSWNGANVRQGSQYFIACAGGHDGYAGNQVSLLDLVTEIPGWVRLIDPHEPQIFPINGYYAPNQPAARHMYHHSVYIPPLSGSPNGDKWFACKMSAGWADGEPNSPNSPKAAVFDFGTNAYLAEDAWPDFAADGDGGIETSHCFDSDNQLCWMIGAGNSRALHSFNPRTKTYSAALESQFSGFEVASSPICKATGTNWLVFLWKLNSNRLRVYDITNPSAPTVAVVETSGLPALGAPALVWEPVGQKLVVFDIGTGDQIYAASIPANPQTDTWVFSPVANASGTLLPTSSRVNEAGVYTRFQHASAIGCFVYVNNVNGPTYIWKVPAGGL